MTLILPISTMFYCIATGVIIGIAYQYLLWLTVKLLPTVRHKLLWLFFSRTIRLFMLLFTAIVVSQDQVTNFLWIIFAFLITRWLIINFAKNIKRNHD